MAGNIHLNFLFLNILFKECIDLMKLSGIRIQTIQLLFFCKLMSFSFAQLFFRFHIVSEQYFIQFPVNYYCHGCLFTFWNVDRCNGSGIYLGCVIRYRGCNIFYSHKIFGMGFENVEKKQNDRNVSRTSCTFYLGKSQRGVSYIYFQVPVFLVHLHFLYTMVQHLPLPYYSSRKR